MHLGIQGRLEREKDLVEVHDPARSVAQRRREHALVAERYELPGLHAEGDPRCNQRRDDCNPDARNSRADERGHDRERSDCEALARRCADPRGSATRTQWPAREAVMREAFYARATASSDRAPSTVCEIVSSPHHGGRDTMGGRGGAGRARRASGATRSSQRRSRRPRPGVARPERAPGRTPPHRSSPSRPPARRSTSTSGRRRGTVRDRRGHPAPRLRASSRRRRDPPPPSARERLRACVPSRRAWRPARARRAPAASDPATRTAASKLDSGGSPTAYRGSQSRMTTTPSWAVSSSSFTMSCPRRALVGQCTRRSDSPCSYSRTEWKSKPAARRRRTRRPSPAARPASEKRPSSAVRRGRTTTVAGSHSTARRDRDEAEEIAEDDSRIGELVRRHAAAARGHSAFRQAGRALASGMSTRRALPTISRTVIEPSGIRERRRTPSATRTASPSIAGKDRTSCTT